MKLTALKFSCFAAFLLMALPCAHANLYHFGLAGGDSTASVDFCSSAATGATVVPGSSDLGACTAPPSAPGMDHWTVDGLDILYQQWFWYRVGNSTAEQSIDNLRLASAVNTPTALTLDFQDGATLAASTYTVTIAYTLAAGAPGSHTADIDETINIHNLTATALDMHFFQYSDFDLLGRGASPSDSVSVTTVRPGSGTATQSAGNAVLTESVSGTTAVPVPSRTEVGVYPSTVNKLNDGNVDNLNHLVPLGVDSTNAGPGDVTWAFQWDRSINAGGNLIISKDKHYEATLASVPEPATLMLLGGCLLVIGRKLTLRFKA